MLIDKRIEYLIKRINRKGMLQEGYAFNLNSEINKSKIDWEFKYGEKFPNRCMLYQNSYSDIYWGQINIDTNTNEVTPTYDHDLEITYDRKQFNLRIPNSFIKLDVEFRRSRTNVSTWKDSDDDSLLISNSLGDYHLVDNVNQSIKQLYTREYIFRLFKLVAIEYKIYPVDVIIHNKLTHFVDTTTGLIEKAFLDILSDSLKVSKEEIKSKILEKYKNPLFYFKNVDLLYLDFYEEVKRIKRSGSRLVYASEHYDSASKYVGRVSYSDKLRDRIVNLIEVEEKKEVIMSPPHFDYAIVFRDKFENIIGIFHLSSSTYVIENGRNVDVDIDRKSFENLLNFMKNNAANTAPPPTG